MRRSLGSLNVIIILLMGGFLAVAVYVFRPKPGIRPPQPIKPVAVSVITISPSRYQAYVYTQGTVVPSREINVVAEVSGQTIAVADEFSNGSFFRKGDVFARLDDRDHRYQLINANAQIAIAEKELALEKGRARQAQREWRDLGSDEANALALREPQVNAAQAQVSAAIATRDQVLLDIERTVIKAPFNGRIQQTHVDLGQYVTAGSTIAKIYDDAYAEVRLPLTNQQIALINLPLDSSLSAEVAPNVELSATIAGKTHQWPVKLSRTEASVDSRTRFYFGVAKIPEPFNLDRYSSPIVMGLFVEAKITAQVFDHAINIPETGVLQQQFIYIVDDNNILQKRKVSIVGKDNGRVWLQGDFSNNEKVVVSDVRVLLDGAEVSPDIVVE